MNEDCEWSALSSLGQMLRLTRPAKIAYRTKRFEFRSLCQGTGLNSPHTTPLVKTIQANHLQQPKKKKNKRVCMHLKLYEQIGFFEFISFSFPSPVANYRLFTICETTGLPMLAGNIVKLLGENEECL